jgi:hypothetical protein
MVAAGALMTTRTYRSGTNKTGRDDNELVTGTSDIDAFAKWRPAPQTSD